MNKINSPSTNSSFSPATKTSIIQPSLTVVSVVEMETVCPRGKRAWRAFKNKDDLKKHLMDSSECLPKWRLFIHWDQQDVHELDEAEEWMSKQQKDDNKQSWNEMPGKEPNAVCFYCEVNNGMQWVKTKKSKKWVVCCQTCADPSESSVFGNKVVPNSDFDVGFSKGFEKGFEMGFQKGIGKGGSSSSTRLKLRSPSPRGTKRPYQ